MMKVKDFIIKHWSIISSIIIAVLIVFVVKLQCAAHDMNGQFAKSMVEMKQLQEGIVRSQTSYVSKDDLNDYAKQMDLNLSVIKKDMDGFNASIKGISVLLAHSIGRKETGISSTRTGPKNTDVPNPHTCPNNKECKDPYGHLTEAQILALIETFSDGSNIPIGEVTFESWKKEPWSIEQYPRNYNVTTVIGQDREGKHYTYSKFEIETDDKKYTVPIAKSELIEELPEAEVSWWNPRVGIGVYGGVSFNTSPLPDENIVSGSVTPSFSFSPFSYGRTNVKPDWVFARIGMGYDAAQNTLNFSLAPAMWNIGSEIEFIQNTYIGPVIGADIEGNVSVGAGFSTDL